MLVALIVSPALPGRDSLTEALTRAGGTVCYSSARVRGDVEITADVREATRASGDMLVIDVDAGPGPTLVDAVRNWRIARPRGRVLLLAPGREPPDSTVSRLVELGVYDIIDADPIDGDWTGILPAALERVRTYADAARWHVAEAVPARPGGGAGSVIVERVYAGTVILPVLGARGSGSTLVSLLAADYLTRQGQRAAVVEACPEPARWTWPTDSDKGYALAGRLHVYAPDIGDDDPVEAGLSHLRRLHGGSQYQYIVADFGPSLAVQAVRDEIVRAGTCLVVVSPASWRRVAAQTLVAAVADLAARVRVLVSPSADPHAGRDLVDILGPLKVAAVSMPTVDLAGDVPRPSQASDEALADALAPVFEPAPRQGFLSRLRRW